MRPRQFSASLQSPLFSVPYVSSRYGQPVEARGTLLNPEAPSSYKIIYSAISTRKILRHFPGTAGGVGR